MVIDVGNGITATVYADREVSVTTPVSLVWESRRRETIQTEFGFGWGYGTVSATPSSSSPGGTAFIFPALGWFDYDPSVVPTRLRDYPGTDVIAAVTSGWLPPRGEIATQHYRYTLHHRDTGITDYLDGYGRGLASIDAGGARTDWWFGNTNLDYLGMVYPDGSMLRFDELAERGQFVVTAPDGLLSFVRLDLTQNPTPIAELKTPRLWSEFEYGQGGGSSTHLSSIRTWHPGTSAESVVEFRWGDGIYDIRRDGELLYPVP